MYHFLDRMLNEESSKPGDCKAILLPLLFLTGSHGTTGCFDEEN